MLGVLLLAVLGALAAGVAVAHMLEGYRHVALSAFGASLSLLLPAAFLLGALVSSWSSSS